MAIDSASGALPPSRRWTIPSSSASAASNVIAFTSSLLPSAKCSAHQCGDMRGCAGGEPGPVMAAFEHRNNAPAAAAVGHLAQLQRYPGEILGLPVELGEGVAIVSVEPRRDQQEVWPERLERRQDTPLIRRPHLV